MWGVACSTTWGIGMMQNMMQNIKLVSLHVQRLMMCITVLVSHSATSFQVIKHSFWVTFLVEFMVIITNLQITEFVRTDKSCIIHHLTNDLVTADMGWGDWLKVQFYLASSNKIILSQYLPEQQLVVALDTFCKPHQSKNSVTVIHTQLSVNLLGILVRKRARHYK
jgi:hypothetical protein